MRCTKKWLKNLIAKQLLRRISTIEYHYVENGEYKSYSIPANEYTTYEDLKQKAHADSSGFVNASQMDLSVFEK